MVRLWKRYAQKLRSIFLLHFGLVTVRFGYGRNRTPLISMISGFLDVSFLPKTNYFYLWRPRDTSNNFKKNSQIILEIIFINLICLESSNLKSWKGRVPTNRDGQYWIWDQYLGISINIG